MNSRLLKLVLLVTIIFTFSFKDNGVGPSSAEEVRRGLDQTFIRESHNGNVRLYNTRLNGKKFGHSIWMSRKNGRIGAKYFAFKDRINGRVKTVYNRFDKWRAREDVVLACSGAFSTELPGATNKNAKTVGLTVDNGKIVNRNIEYSMDGLVIVYATGGIVVSDIENKDLRIGSQRINVIKDKVKLLNWAVENGATIFQTQLLAYDNSLRISRAGRKNKRERRFLALAKSSKNELFHIIFDIPEYNYLFDASKEVFYFLSEEKGMDVFAILNLDTGAYNIMELYKDNRKRDFKITGDTDIKTSTNLIVYYSK